MEKYYKTYFNNSEQPIIVLNPERYDFIIMDVNKSFLKLTKFKYNDIIGHKFIDLLSKNCKKGKEKNIDFVIKAITNSVNKKTKTISPKIECPLLKKNKKKNNELIYEFESLPVFNNKKKLEFIILTLIEKPSTTGNQISLEKTFQTIIKNGGDVVVILGEDGFPKYVSPSIKKVLGYTPEEALKLNLFDVVHPESIPELNIKLNEIMKKPGIPIKGVTSRVKHKNGKWRWFEATITNMLHDPEINGIVDNLRDVTERIELENEKNEIIKTLNERVKEQTCLYLLTNLSTLNITLDEYFENAADIIPTGWQFPNITAASIRFNNKTYKTENFKFTKWKLSVERVTQNNKKLKISVCYIKKPEVKTENIFLNEEVSLLNTIADNFIIVINNIISKEEVNKVMKHSIDIICTIDEKGNFLSVNDAVERILGYKVDEIVGKNYTEFIFQEDIEKTNKLALDLKSSLTATNFENRYLKKDGTIVPLYWSVQWYENDRIYYCITRDATEIIAKQLEVNTLINNTDEAFILVDKKLNIVSFNKQFRELYLKYFNIEVKKGDSILNYAMPERKEALKKVYKNVLNGYREQSEIEVKASDGTVYYSIVYKPAKDIYDNIIGVFVTSKNITENKKILSELEESELKYKTLFNSSPLPKWVYDIETFKIIDVNKTAIEHYGYSKEEFLNMTIMDIRPKEDIPKVIAAHQNTVDDNGNIYFGVFNHKKKNGEIIRMAITGNKLIYAGKNCMMVVCNDVTKTEKYINEIKEVNQRFELVTKATFDAVWDFNLINNKLHWGNGFSELFGYENYENDLSYNKWIDNVHPDDLIRVNNKVDEILKSNELTWQQEYRFRKKDGTYAFILDRALVVRDENNLPTRILGAMHDITEQKLREQQLKLMESVITNTNDMVMITEAEPFDEPGPKIIYVNEAFTKITGYSPEEVIGKTPRILQGPRTDKNELKKLKDSLKQWKPCEITVVNYRKNGEEYWNNLSVSPVADEIGWFTHWISIERDVTKQKIEENKNILFSEISFAFSKDEEINAALNTAMNKILDFDDFCLAETWIIDKYLFNINLNAFAFSDEKIKTFYSITKKINSFVKGSGLAGAVWETPKITCWNDVDRSYRFSRSDAAKIAGIKSVIGIPIFNKNEVVGVLVLGFKYNKDKSSFYPIYNEIAALLGSEIKRKSLENELNQIFNTAPDIIAIAGIDASFKKINPATSEILEYSEEELLSTKFTDFIHHEDLAKTYNEVENLSKGIQTIYFENRYITKSGKIKWIAWSASSSPKDGLIFAVGKDISHTKELEVLLKEANKLAKIGSWDVDLINNKMYWSDITKEIHELDLDYQPNLEDGINFYKEGEHREKVNKAVQEGIENGTPWDVELIIVTEKGKEKWVRAIGGVEFLDGKPIRLYGSIQDINEKKLAELNVQKVLDEKIDILESIGDAFFTVNKDFTVTYWNRLAEILLMVPRDKIIGKNLWEVFADAVHLPSYKNYYKAINEQITVNFEDYYEPIDKWFEVSAYPSQSGLSVYFKDITDKKKFEINLLKTLKEKNTILESIKDGFFSVNKNWIVTYWNKTAEEFLGTKRENIVNKNLWDVYTDAVELEFYKQYHKAMNENVTVNFEEYYPVLEKWFDVSVYPSNDGISVYFRDITDKKKYLLNIKKANEEKANILESISDYFYSLDKNYNFIYMNSACEKLLRVEPKSLIGKNLFEVYPVLKNTEVEYNIKLVEQIGKPSKFEFFDPNKKKWFDETFYPNENGFSIFFQDITERKKAEEEILLAKERFVMATEATKDAIWDLDLTTNLIYFGEGFKTQFGYYLTNEKNDLDIWTVNIHKDDVDLVLNDLNRTLKDKTKNKWQFEYRFLKKDGTIAYVIDKGSILRDKDGNAIRMVGAMHDITEQKKYEDSLKKLNEELEKSNKELAASNSELEQFAYIASHDLQEPLRMVTSFMSQLNKKYDSVLDEKAKRYIHFAVDGSKRMREIILDLLEFSRVGSQDEKIEAVDTNQLVNDIHHLFRKIITDKKALIIYENLPIVNTFKAPLRQMLQNLINNALKYHQKDIAPIVKICATEKDDKYWQFSISDNGIGIEKEYHEKIFIIFQRLHNKEEYSGNGMGLAIAKKIIEKLGGNIWLESEVGKGTTFYFTVPK